ncbi:hypothetical protein V6N13_066334 [Hibiscus sabdariffa]
MIVFDPMSGALAAASAWQQNQNVSATNMPFAKSSLHLGFKKARELRSLVFSALQTSSLNRREGIKRR